MLIPHLMPVFMVFCFALGIWVRLPILVAAGLASLVFFLLGVEWNLPVAPDWIHLWGATLLNDAFQAFCLILLMVLLLDRIGWTIEWVDAIDGFLGPVGSFAIAALLWLTAVGLSFYGPAATSPPAAIYFGCVFLAAMFLGPYALRVAVQSVAAPKRFTAMLASFGVIFSMLDDMLGTPFLGLTSVLLICSAFALRHAHRSRFIGAQRPQNLKPTPRVLQGFMLAAVLVLCTCLTALVALDGAVSAASFDHLHVTMVAYVCALVAISVLHLMAARPPLVSFPEPWLRRLIALTPVYLLLIAFSLIFLGWATLFESALLATVFLTVLVLLRGQFRWGMFMQVLLQCAYFVLIGLVMLWFYFPTLHAWMTNAGWLDAP